MYSIDINVSFVKAAFLVNNQLANPVDAILTGDWDAVEEYCASNAVPDAIAGTDVIEHIYDVGAFLKKIKALNQAMVAVFTTASVTANPFKTFTIKKLQRQDECRYSNPGHTTTDNPFAGLSFLEVRKQIIQQNYAFDKQTITALAKATRGMNKADVLKAVNNYIHTQQLPVGITHPTNTCDPITGNWTEQLLTINEYKALYKNAGFSLAVYNGFYNEWQPAIKSYLLKAVNRYLPLSGRFGRWLTPYIVLAGK